MADDNKAIINYLVKIDNRLMTVEQNLATKKDLEQLEAGMHQRFDVVDNDLNVLINHAGALLGRIGAGARVSEPCVLALGEPEEPQ
jgi:hypothetical protein